MALIAGSPATAAFYFAVNVRAILGASNKTVADLAIASGMSLHKLVLILNTETEENAQLSLNNAANFIFPALRRLAGLNEWVGFESLCSRDLLEGADRLTVLFAKKGNRFDSTL